MRFEGLDLNLLVAFDIFLSERSVSKAAERLNLSQPATSAALSRLREYFKDPILVQHGHRMYATKHAEKLIPHVKALLSTARTITSIPSEFDHRKSSRIFRVGGADCLMAAFFSEFAAQLSKSSPNIQFELSLASNLSEQMLEFGELDLMIAAQEPESPNFVCETLYEDTHVLLGCSRNPAFQNPVTKKQFLEFDFIGLDEANSKANYGQARLVAMNLSTSIKLIVPSFSVVPWLLMGTERVCIVPKRLAEKLCSGFDLKITTLPYEFPTLQITLKYHRSRSNDPGLRWLVDTFIESIERHPKQQKQEAER